MANIKSAKKRIDVTRKRTALNRVDKTELKTYIKKFEAAISNGDIDEAQNLLKIVDRHLKKAAHKNILHKNSASRKLSQLTKKLNKAM